MEIQYIPNTPRKYLTIEQGLEIYKRIQKKEHKCLLADEYGVHKNTIDNIEYMRHRWKCLASLVNTA